MAEAQRELPHAVRIAEPQSGLATKDFLQRFNAVIRALKPQATTVDNLPSAASSGAGARYFVTDANATTFLSVVAGGGANKVPVVSDGTDWLIG